LIKGIKYISLAETTGYGLSAVAYIRALRSAGVPVTWHPRVYSPTGYRPATRVEEARSGLTSVTGIDNLYDAFHAPVEYDTVVVHMTPEYWPGVIEPGKRMVGYSVWETDRLPLHWPPMLEGYDLVLTPSTFSRDVFAQHARAPVEIVPHLPRTDWPSADAAELSAFRRRFGVGESDFLFYTVNTWILRKAMWLTLQAFLLAFSEDDNAVLLVKTNPHGEAEGQSWGPSRRLFDRIMANYPDPARVVFVPEELDHADIGLLHLAGDAFVSLTRSEGFGMGAYDAAAAGTPVIMTGWSGQLDFLPPEHACRVDYELRRVKAHLGDHVPQEQYWAHADVDDAIGWMRRMYENPDEARQRGAGLKAHIAEHFNAPSITRRLLDALNG
jgi:glycosyltransferase involved in cell wall biosynthesis